MRRNLIAFLTKSLLVLRHHRQGIRDAGRGQFWKPLALSLAFCASGLALAPARASDHADPISLSDPEANITDLFFFPQGDRMIIVFDVRRSLTNPGPYVLDPYVYQINFDFKTPVTFDSEEDRARYGGTIPQSEGISPSAMITLRLENDGANGVKLKEATYSGKLAHTEDIDVNVGVRDDPFIFPRFFKRNTIATVISLPKNAFPEGQENFILWATASKGNEIVDYVGRSLRTQLPRFGFLNALPPGEQVRALREKKKSLDDIYAFFHDKREDWARAVADLMQFTFQIRKYDLAPDVMIYSTRYRAGYPNGRLLTDDVVALTCATGDCLLQELSFIEGNWPRATVNDKPLLSQYPFLAEKWDKLTAPPPPTDSIWPYIIVILIVLAILSWFAVEGIRRLIAWLWRSLRRKPATA